MDGATYLSSDNIELGWTVPPTHCCHSGHITLSAVNQSPMSYCFKKGQARSPGTTTGNVRKEISAQLMSAVLLELKSAVNAKVMYAKLLIDTKMRVRAREKSSYNFKNRPESGHNSL